VKQLAQKLLILIIKLWIWNCFRLVL